MHVLVIPSWYPRFNGDVGGSFFREQAVALSKNGCNVGVIYPQHRSLRDWQSIISRSYGFEHEVDDSVPTLRWHGMRWLPKVPRVSVALWIRHGLKLYRRYIELYGKPDILHAQSMLYAASLALEIKRRYRVPFVITEHSSAYAREKVTPWQVQLAAKSLAHSSRRFAVSDSLCTLLAERFDTPPGTWEVMPNIVNRAFIDSSLPRRVSDARPFVFINIALLTRNKAVHNLIEAFRKAFKCDSAAILRIGGNGPERARLEALSERLGLQDRIQFLGGLSREQVLEEISRADALVSSSLYETFGVVVIEALALGKPVVATRSGGPESIVEEQDGLLVPPNDVPALADAMKALRQERDSYDSTQIRNRCITRYGEKALANRLLWVYREIVGVEKGAT